MKNLYLIAEIAGEKVAIIAEQVDSVVKIKDSVSVPSAEPFIGGLFALRSRVLTLIDCQYFVTGEKCRETANKEAIVVKIGGYSYGLIVDGVQDVISATEKPQKLQRTLPDGWDGLGSCLLEINNITYLVVEPEKLVNPPHRRAA